MKFTTRQKMLVSLSLVVLVMLSMGMFAYYQLSQLETGITTAQGKVVPLGRAKASLWELRWNLVQLQSLTDFDARRKLLADQARLAKSVDESFKAIHDNENISMSAAEAEKYRLATEAWARLRDSQAALGAPAAPVAAPTSAASAPAATDGKPDDAGATRDSGAREKTADTLAAIAQQALLELTDLSEKADEAQRTEQLQDAARIKYLMAALGLVASSLGAVALFFVARSFALLDRQLVTAKRNAREADQISNSVVEIMQAMGLVAVNKDLSIQVPVTEDVTGAIGDAMNMLTSSTAKVLRTVTSVSNEVALSSQNVKQGADAMLAANADSQLEVESAARELSQAAATLNQMAQMAQKANESAEQAVRNTQQALATVDRTVKGINESRDVIRETEKRIKRLGERSQEISQVVGIINSIAERTGLLALNASMQATAAGDAGRGFALVAEEVKRLSENAREATREITTLVSSIQSETSEAVLTMNNAISQVVDLSRLADQAGSEMKGSQQATDVLAVNVRNIATTSTEQARVGQALQARAQTIQQSSRETTRQLTVQNELTTKLVIYAQDLLREVGVFKLPAANS